MASGQTLDEVQIVALHSLHARELERFAWGIVRDWELAGDAVQNAFLALAVHGGNTLPEARKSWLFKVTLREALKLRNSQRKLSSGEVVCEAPASYHAEPSARIVAEEEVNQIRGFVSELPFEQRQVLEMRLQDGKSFQAIADSLGIPIGTALSRMRIALEKIREKANSDE